MSADEKVGVCYIFRAYWYNSIAFGYSLAENAVFPRSLSWVNFTDKMVLLLTVDISDFKFECVLFENIYIYINYY